MERETEVVLVLCRLRALGVRLAIDDIPQLEDDKEVASAIIGMGHTLRLQVLAEGVETQEQLDFLKEHGCDFYQGYLKSPALAADDFTALLQSQS
ncbi:MULTISPECIES: EAL domain-containing protein [Methylomonas]|uniref:EAL domain-containing protein n=2 Tax=Methylomonas TaxID=416 RepID=A0A126T954_9GAMM|nr:MULTISPECIES: EAL domain-containing protein [Methylomonas]AMK78568.1 hypothetical protein JT25_019075 [Methylomonas denitrificans]OAH98898.1 hypothetical protein A1342_09920 [Methylomonas methanica]TCV77403.1 EAL domain-containing protein [Methylomonas methanica]